MKARIEQLALKFRVPSGAPRVAAQIPSLERALNARLADEIARQLDAIDDGGEEVLVVREATAHVTLRLGENSREPASVDRVSQAARNAVIALLARPGDDEDHVRRFPSDAAFAGTFVVELLDGTAWDRWYFEGFRRFRRAGAGATLVALLADVDTDVMALFAWLETRGRLAETLQLIGPAAARALASVAPPVKDAQLPPDLAPLSAAAFAITAALGVRVPLERQPVLLAEFFRLEPSRPVWIERRALTEWVWRFSQWIVAREFTGSAARSDNAAPLAPLISLLSGQLDWLDGAWLVTQAEMLVQISPESRTMHSRVATLNQILPRHAGHFRRLEELISRGALRLDLRSEPHDQLVLRLAAALTESKDSSISTPDHGLLALLDSLITPAKKLYVDEQLLLANRHPISGNSSRAASSQQSENLELALNVARQHGPHAVALMRALIGPLEADDSARSPYVGLYLLARPISDLRLERLAKRAGVPWAPLLAALAVKLLGATQPFDEATRLWLNAENSDTDALDENSLRSLQKLVLQSLADQRLFSADEVMESRFDWRDESFEALSNASGTCWPFVSRAGAASAEALLAEWRDAMPQEPAPLEGIRSPTADLEGLSAAPALPAAIEVHVTSIAASVLHAMSRWLPGLSGSSMPFLVRNSLARSGSVSVTDEDLLVVLDHAPLDIVLEMAGCFAPLGTVSWLGRGVRFSFAARE